MLQFVCSQFTVLFANTPFATIDTVIMRISRLVLYCKKGVLTNFAKLTKKHQKILAQIFSCEFFKISQNIFFKEAFGRLLHHKDLFCLLSYHDLSPFQKQCHKYFVQYFFGLTCRLGTSARSIFQALSQKPIFNPAEHLRQSFYHENSKQLKKTLKYFLEKSPIVMFDQALNTNL